MKKVLIKHGASFGVIIGVYILLSIINIENAVYTFVQSFYLDHFWVFIIISVLHLLADIFKKFKFPLNLIFVILNALAVVAGVVLMLTFIELAISQYSLRLALKVTSFGVHLFRLVFVVAVLVSLWQVFQNLKFKGKKRLKDED